MTKGGFSKKRGEEGGGLEGREWPQERGSENDPKRSLILAVVTVKDGYLKIALTNSKKTTFFWLIYGSRGRLYRLGNTHIWGRGRSAFFVKVKHVRIRH